MTKQSQGSRVPEIASSSAKKYGVLLAMTFLIISTTFAHDAKLSPLRGRIIVLDPGHGVINYEGKIINPGRESRDGSMEHRLALDIALKVGEILENEGANVFYTRTMSDYWRQGYSTVQDNKARALFANEVKADAFIAIHCDWDWSKKIHGVTTFYGKKQSERLAVCVHRSMIKSLKAYDRKTVMDTYTVLDVAQVPAIILETGFLSNKSESKKLAKATYQKEIAVAISKGLKNYFSKS